MGLPLNTIIQVGLEGKLFEQRVLTVLHYRVSIVSGVPNYFDEMNGLGTWFTNPGPVSFRDTFRACVPAEYTFQTVRVQAIFPTRFAAVRRVVNQAGTGDSTTTANVSQAITTSTIKAGRTQIGGVRLPLATTRSLNGSLTAAALTALDNFAAQLELPAEEPVQGGLYSPVIFHRGPNVNPRWDDIINATPQTTTRVVRRRTVGLGI